MGGKLVWDYASDNYVQRLIQNIVDGKMVEHQSEDVFLFFCLLQNFRGESTMKNWKVYKWN